MRNIIKLAVVFITLPSCTKNSEPHASKEQSKMSIAKKETYAKEDFDAVLKGQRPIHAISDPKKPDLTDGGTTFYSGDGYALTIKSTLFEKDGIKGYMYGPIITFEDGGKEMS